MSIESSTPTAQHSEDPTNLQSSLTNPLPVSSMFSPSHPGGVGATWPLDHLPSSEAPFAKPSLAVPPMHESTGTTLPPTTEVGNNGGTHSGSLGLPNIEAKHEVVENLLAAPGRPEAEVPEGEEADAEYEQEEVQSGAPIIGQEARGEDIVEQARGGDDTVQGAIRYGSNDDGGKDEDDYHMEQLNKARMLEQYSYSYERGHDEEHMHSERGEITPSAAPDFGYSAPPAAASPAFIPALSHPRPAHLNDSTMDESPRGRKPVASTSSNGFRPAPPGPRPSSTSSYVAQSSHTFGAAPPATVTPVVTKPAGRIRKPVIKKQDSFSQSPPVSTDSSDLDDEEVYDEEDDYSSAQESSRKRRHSKVTPKVKRSNGKKVSVHSSVPGGATLVTPGGQKRTEIPAVEGDPSIKPYGCCYPHCLAETAKAEQAGKAGPENTFRTVKELRDHCTRHKKAKYNEPDTPFRCSLDPCGKTFKSLAGLRWHFQNASSNGHFLVSKEDGEDRPTKKFKVCATSSGRVEKCPVRHCSKSFKQAAGLAYHLAHAPKHVITENMLNGYSITLTSKTKWWFNKLNKKMGKDDGQIYDAPSDGEEEEWQGSMMDDEGAEYEEGAEEQGVEEMAGDWQEEMYGEA